MIDEEKQADTTSRLADSPSGLSEEEATAAGTEDYSHNADESTVLEDGELDVASEVESPTSETTDESPSSGLLESLAAQEAEIESLKTQLQDLTSQSKRIAADFDNYRKRTQKEKEDLEEQVKCSTLRELLPVIDNFERARSQLKSVTDAEVIHKSYQSVYKQLVDCLKRIGVAPMRAEGKEFDPNLHEAVMREATDQQPEGTVLEELMRGYMLNERVLRHAMVKVAAPPEPGSSSSESASEAGSES